MTLTDSIAVQGLQSALQQARSKLTRQQMAVKTTIELVKLLEQAIKDTESKPATR